jgi:hypothetical protein
VAHPRPKKKVLQNGKSRWNLRVPADLDKWAKKYAKEHNTTVTQLIVDHFTDLQKKEEEAHVEQF